ncbi:MAG: hypothetical protein V9E94_21275 [Microthrixaceae bacterium]
MRIESSVTSPALDPLRGGHRAEQGRVRHPASPTTTRRHRTTIDDLEALRDGDRFRFANHLSAWIEVVDGRIVDAGTRAAAARWAPPRCRSGPRQVTYAAVAFPDLGARAPGRRPIGPLRPDRRRAHGSAGTAPTHVARPSSRSRRRRSGPRWR